LISQVRLIKEKRLQRERISLENELGRDLEKSGLDYGLQVRIGKNVYDAVSGLFSDEKSFLFRIEAKYVCPDNEKKHLNIRKWTSKYSQNPFPFYHKTLLYLNYDFYKSLEEYDIKSMYRTGLIQVSFHNLNEKIRHIMMNVGEHLPPYPE